MSDKKSRRTTFCEKPGTQRLHGNMNRKAERLRTATVRRTS